jgi:DNA primase
MALSKDTIDRVRDSADLVEVIGDYVTLKKRGLNYIACCPFHNEKTPSFNVSPSKGIYKCFGCGAAGDSIQFVMDIEGIGYLEAIKQLARKYGIEAEEKEISNDEKVLQNERERLFIVLNFAKNFYQQNLHNHEEGKSIGLSYFQERGFVPQIIKKFELGYSLDVWDSFYQEAIKNQFDQEILEKAGLIIKKESSSEGKSSFYDRFRARVIFPIHNISGKTIAFGARILKTDKNQPKYINSPETDVYHKSEVLYGLFQAKNAIRNADNCYLVEGYTDVISMHLAGVENVVASSGTSLTEGQIRQIRRFTENVTVLYDGDSAGIKASMRGIDLILESGLNVQVVLFPDGEDPDSYSRKVGSEMFAAYIKDKASDFITFKAQILLKEAGDNPIKRAGIIKDIVESISKIPDTIKRAVLLKQCSLLMQIDEQLLVSEANKVLLSKNSKKSTEPIDSTLPSEQEQTHVSSQQKPDLPSPASILEKQEYELIRLLVNFGNERLPGEILFKDMIIAELSDHEFKSELYKNLFHYVIHESIDASGNIDNGLLLANQNYEQKKMLIDMLTAKYQVSQNWEKFQIFIQRESDNLPITLYTSMMRLKWRSIRDMIEINIENLLQPLDDEEIQRFQKIHIQLKSLEKEIAQVLGIVVAK